MEIIGTAHPQTVAHTPHIMTMCMRMWIHTPSKNTLSRHNGCSMLTFLRSDPEGDEYAEPFDSIQDQTKLTRHPNMEMYVIYQTQHTILHNISSNR